MQQIEKKHGCPNHKGKACYVQTDYTFEDLTIWATLMVDIIHMFNFVSSLWLTKLYQWRNLATIDMPPQKLNLADKLKHQVVIKKNAVIAAAPSNVWPGLSQQAGFPPWMFPPWMMPIVYNQQISLDLSNSESL
jgi:hypothetical protein